MTLDTEREEILRSGAEQREREIMHYQINIDNYRLAIADIEANHVDDVPMQDFAIALREMLASSRIEQAKEQIMLKAINGQLE